MEIKPYQSKDCSTAEWEKVMGFGKNMKFGFF